MTALSSPAIGTATGMGGYRSAATTTLWPIASCGVTTTLTSPIRRRSCMSATTHHALRSATYAPEPEPRTARTWLPRDDRPRQGERPAEGPSSPVGTWLPSGLHTPLGQASPLWRLGTAFTTLTFRGSFEVSVASTTDNPAEAKQRGFLA